MKERPILFSSPMVRAILEVRKTQTRRVVKSQGAVLTDKMARFLGVQPPSVQNSAVIPCPFGQPGDRLWVRETWQHSNFPLGPFMESCDVFYRADYLDDPLGPDLELSGDGIRRQWKPSIHMPRAASRILLEIVSVRVERLNDISEADAVAEGIKRAREPLSYLWNYDYPDNGCGTTGYDETPGPIAAFRHLWREINGQGSWQANPWVWVIEFRRVQP